MNIFYTHRSPRKCARSLDDVRLRKMVLETAQMLCTALNVQAGKKVTPYSNAHEHNRLTKWAMVPQNWIWLWDLGMELGREYHYRFGKMHASFMVIQMLVEIAPAEWPRKAKHPERFVNATRNKKLGLSYTHILPVKKAYRKYLRRRWKLDVRPPQWTKRGPPSWK